MGAFEAESEPRSEHSASRKLEEPSPPALLDDGDAVTPIPVGDLVSGRWVVDGVLGNGAMGVVCAAHHVDLGQRVAVKFLRATYSRNESIVQRFLDEARAAAALRSEHIVRVFDIGETSTGLPYFVMEYLEGTTLEEKIRHGGPVGAERAIDYVLQACDGLREVHSAGIVHRDVKPENLFLASNGGSKKEIVKVVDFGIAKRLDATRAKIVTGPQDKIGSPCYMSPEQMVSPKLVDPRTDVWALGVVLYQSLTGRLPFDGNTLEEMFEQIQSADAAPPSRFRPEVDFALDAIVARCLRKNPADRFQSIEELAAELEKYRTPREWRATPALDEQVWLRSARSDAPVSAPPRQRTRGPAWPVAIATVVGAVVTLAGAAFVWTSRDSDAEVPVSAARAPSKASTDAPATKTPPPALLQPLGAVAAQAPQTTEAATIPAEPEVKRDAAELARARKQARARAHATASRTPTPAAPKADATPHAAAPAAAPPAPGPAPSPREEPVATAPDDSPVPEGDDSYPEYLKKNGWRPLKDVLTEIEGKSPPAPPRNAAPEVPPPPAPPPPPEPEAPPAV